MATKQTKAQRLFFHGYYAALRHIDTWGMDNFDAWSSLHDDTDECIYRRTVNAILKECDKMDKDIQRLIRFEIIAEEEAAPRRKAVLVMRNTCANWIKNEEEWRNI